MADINVERRGPSLWPWIVGLIVLAVLIWALVEMFGTTGDPDVIAPADTAVVDPFPAPAPPPAMTPPMPGDTLAPPAAGVPADTVPGTGADTIVAPSPAATPG